MKKDNEKKEKRMREVKKKFLNVYQGFFENKGLLGEMEALLSVSPDLIQAEEGWGPQTSLADTNLLSLFSHLTGGLDFKNDECTKIIDQVNIGYKDQPYWRELLFDYIEYWLIKEEKEIIEEEKNLLKEVKETLKDVMLVEAQEKKAIQAFAAKIKEAGFKVNAEQLVTNYFKMVKKNKEEAWSVLISNPALFSPILVKDEKGVVRLTPDQAREENNKLAKFLKRLKL